MPLSPYAVQKLTCEYYIQAFYRVYGLQGVCTRYFNIFGPRQAADSPYSGVIAQFIYKMMAGETPTIFGDGSTSRDFTYVDNAVNANLLACVAPDAVATGRVFNIGTGKSQTLNDVYAASRKFLASPKSRSTALRARETFSIHSRASTVLATSWATSLRTISSRVSRRPWPGMSRKLHANSQTTQKRGLHRRPAFLRHILRLGNAFGAMKAFHPRTQSKNLKSFSLLFDT